MADALLKVSDATKKADACKTADDDGLLVTTLLEALTATNRLDVGAHGRTTYTPSNYSTAGQSLDEHLTGIDSVLAGVGAAHALGGGQHSADTLANLNAKVTGGDLDFDSASRPPSGSATGDLTSSYPNPQVAKIRGYAVQAHAPLDGEVLQWVAGNSQYEPTAAGAPGAHLLGGTSHTADSLANLNSKINFGNLDFDTNQRPPIQHALGGSYHSADTLANLNAKVSDATLDTNTASRPPSGAASGDLAGSYPDPGVGKLWGYAVQSGAPTTKDILQYIDSQWQHVSGLIPHYDSGWFVMHYSTANNVLKTHNLGVLPRQVQVYVSSDSGSTCHLAGFFWLFSNQVNARGTIVTNITTTTLRVQCGTLSTGGMYDSYGTGGTRIQMSSGHARVLCWK